MSFCHRWIFPAVCLTCKSDRARSGPPLCRTCLRQSPRQGWLSVRNDALEGIFAARRFEGPVRDAIHHFKYARRFYLARLFSRWFGAVRHVLPGDDIHLVPVPMSPWRRWRRGYNPAEMLASELSRRWRLPVERGWLKRRWGSRSQTRLGRSERIRNAREAYHLPSKTNAPLRRGTAILVDDVVTTGSTLLRCATLLRKAGVQRVFAIAIAYDRLARVRSPSRSRR